MKTSIDTATSILRIWIICLITCFVTCTTASACFNQYTSILFENVPAGIDAPVIVEATIYDYKKNVSDAKGVQWVIMKAHTDRVIKGPIDVGALTIVFNPTSCTGTPEDYATVHKLQDECKLVPLSAYGKPYTPPPGKVDPSIDMKTAVREQVNRMDAVAYFKLLCELMKANPPYVADAPQLAKFARIGIVPGQDFDESKLKADFLKRVPELSFDRIMIQFKINKAIKEENGFAFTTKTGIYGTDYPMRALVTAIGLGANRPQDAVYPTSKKDADGQTYNGANKYVMRFPKGHLPPADGFWSLTMYDSGYFFVSNPLNRYSISARQDLKVNPDGSTDLYIQKDSPGKDKESNWLPAPAGDFILMLRMYWPQEADPSIINGTWTVPAAKKVGA